MKTLVIGGNGFIGTNLVDLLLGSGHEVRVFDRYPSRFKPVVDGVEYVTGDCSNHGEMAEVVQGMDWVFHLAYTTLPQTSNDDPVYDITSNIAGTVQLMEECVKSGVKKLIFISSGGTVYGVPRESLVKETHINDPICSYGISKLAIEKYLHLYHHLKGLDYVVARLSNPYGIYQNPDAKQGAIGVFLGNVARHKPITIWGDGKVVRDYIYIDDTVKALLKAAEYVPQADSPRIFNVGHGEGHTLNQIVDAIKHVVGPHVEVNYTSARSVDVPVNVLNINRARTHLKWQPETSLQDGIQKSWEWINTLSLK